MTDRNHNQDPTDYCLGLIAEECSEVIQMVGKAFRFGLDSPGRLDANGDLIPHLTPRTELEKELGDVMAAAEFLVLHDIINADRVAEQAWKKANRLNDPKALDNIGRPLAPQPKNASAHVGARIDRVKVDPVIELRKACAEAGSQLAWARKHHISTTYVSDVLARTELPGPKMLAALGIRQTITYER